MRGFVLDASREYDILAELDDLCLAPPLPGRPRLLMPMPAAFYAARPQNDLSLWAMRRGFYCLPTLELIEWLTREIGPTNLAIEIGAGNGCIGRTLGIPRTDSHMHNRTDIADLYDSIDNATTVYPADVEKLTALQAVEKYQPAVVVAAWVTHKYNKQAHSRGGNFWGVDEGKLLDKVCVRKYIFIGHRGVHAKKPILSRRHQTLPLPFLYSRSPERRNVAWIWEP